jgi:hypothetical protein
MKIRELKRLKQQAELMVESDPELKSLQDKFVKFGCTELESLAAVLGRAFSRLEHAYSKPTKRRLRRQREHAA